MIVFKANGKSMSSRLRILRPFSLVRSLTLSLTSNRNPYEIPWCMAGPDFIVESSEVFTDKDKAVAHLKVIISVSSKDALMFVIGVNEKITSLILTSSPMLVALPSCSSGSNNRFGIVEGLETSVHSITATQKTVNGPSMKDWRGGRVAHSTLFPTVLEPPRY
ncbi:hypothetical protein ACH5RR_023484 [Cinchona calisaya]|uniref:glyceraldehyde-3-phosphate dehydrogenase (phosphorylating) n=1 Tax=Cinchona calisaya TaxID=153742 RepID=A0ABD2ZAT3_9GENT